MKQATAELHSTFLEMQEVAEKNRGEFPDINRIAEEVGWPRARKEKMRLDLRCVRSARLL